MDCMQYTVMNSEWLTAAIILIILYPGCIHRNELPECLNYVCNVLFTDLEIIMIGQSVTSGKTKLQEEYLPRASLSNVAEELKMFGKECE